MFHAEPQPRVLKLDRPTFNSLTNTCILIIGLVLGYVSFRLFKSYMVSILSKHPHGHWFDSMDMWLVVFDVVGLNKTAVIRTELDK